MFRHYRVILRKLVISALPVLYAFFWVIPRRPNFISQRFGTHCLFHPRRRVGMKKHATFRTRRKFEIMNTLPSYTSISNAAVGNTIVGHCTK